MSRRLTEILRGRRRWVATAALLALAPKCVLCVLAYAGIGAALGLGGPEMCGTPAGATGSWVTSLALPGIALGVIGFFAGAITYRHSIKECGKLEKAE